MASTVAHRYLGWQKINRLILGWKELIRVTSGLGGIIRFICRLGGSERACTIGEKKFVTYFFIEKPCSVLPKL